ncbi:MAG: molybdopterin biosynthesis protein [Peptococcaceae bacterium]|nr:molybdopterin biosynthesis protein [Peptococcaceae bacterium]
MKRNIYLSETPLEEALHNYMEFLRSEGALEPGLPERVDVRDAVGRVTAEPVFARNSSPHFHASAMDGVAVRARDTFGASENNPLRLKIGDQAFPVDTGDPLPGDCDAVIMIEDVHYVAEDVIEIIAAAFPWQHVRVIGEDIVATEMIVPANHVIRPVDAGAMLASGVTEVKVYPRPVLTVIPTGTEVVEPGGDLKIGDIVEYNSTVLGAMAQEWGAAFERHAIVPDDYDRLKEAVSGAVENSDIVVINAGSSAGREDYTASLIRELGRVITHGVATKPGKPVVLGAINDKPVLGIPGYPVSAALAFQLFAKPVIYAKLGRVPAPPQTTEAVLSRRVVSPMGVDEFVRVKLGKVGDKIIATPLSRGAGLILTLVRADGILRVPRFNEGFEGGSTVKVELLRPLHEIEETVVVIGSHDIALDVLANYLKIDYPQAGLSSAHVGSLGGLMALKRGEAHLAGTHLLDEETGDYNVSYIKRYLPGLQTVLVNLAYREQGFIVAPGNPKNIKDFSDLARSDVRFVNRQRGAGTRVLLDFHLKRKGIRPAGVQGYEREEYTHMAVAAAVAGGTADCGLGIRAAAQALGLEFVPVAEERYDLCIRADFWDSPHVQRLIKVIEKPEFRKAVENLGGYDLRDCGKIMWDGRIRLQRLP